MESIPPSIFLCYTYAMPDFSYGQVQQTSQVQRQVLSQKQIQSLKLLAMSGEDLNAEIR
ncbi:hypothetical protein, partial [Treponema socranskii]|uniref:hypothetical protein n=1 Tax=Treponema socranskii TaxID=53419 RepID=UPI003605DB41